MHSYRHTALSEILNRIAGKNITKHYLVSHTIFFPMCGLRILLFSLQDSLMQRWSMECQLSEDNDFTQHAMKKLLTESSNKNACNNSKKQMF